MSPVVLITGASRGLGELLAESFAKKGFKVYAGARQIPEAGFGNKTAINYLKLDVRQDSECQEAIRKIDTECGRLDVLVNNAAQLLVGATENFTSEQYREILDTIAVGTFRLIKEAIPVMSRQPAGGRIINITSLNGRIALPNFGLYSSAKFAQEALGLAWRYELQRRKIWVTNIAPGAIAHPMKVAEKLPHVPAREKFRLLRNLLPMISLTDVANATLKVATSPRPPAQVLLGRDSQITVLLQRLLPQFFWDRLLSFVWGR